MMSVNIRSIQHYMYCPRRYGLLEINNDWVENVFVVKANLMHERVHSGEHRYSGKDGFARSSVTLFHDDLDIFGVADCVEFKRTDSGDFTYQGERFKVTLVEYKPTKPKSGMINESDAIQVFAQKLCADYVFKCDSDAYIYYADVKKRIRLPFDSNYNEYYAVTMRLIQEMRQVFDSGIIPVKSKGQKCGGCSIEDVCIPKNRAVSVKAMIKEELS